jgi:hypothetical protein
MKNGYWIDWMQESPPLAITVVYTVILATRTVGERNSENAATRGHRASNIQEQGIIVQCFYLVLKKDSDQMRPAINLKDLNKFIKSPTFKCKCPTFTFKMHSLISIVRMIHKIGWHPKIAGLQRLHSFTYQYI